MLAKNKVLIPGSEAIAEAAVRAGCTRYVGYPEFGPGTFHDCMAELLLEGFMPAESDSAAIASVYGAASAGSRVMTSIGGPGLGRMQEGLSFMAGAEIPCVVLSIGQSGYSLAGILPSQSDYFLSTRPGGQESNRLVVLAPSSVQEAVELTQESFELADRHRNPVLLLADAILSEMMEPTVLPSKRKRAPAVKKWAVGVGDKGPARLITPLFLEPGALEAHTWKLHEKYRKIASQEVRFEEYRCEDAKLVFVAFGIVGRVARTAVDKARKRGMKVGLFRPVSLWPFPSEQLAERTRKARSLLVVELNTGQMIEDVLLATGKPERVHFYGRTGGSIPSSFEMLHEALKWME